MRLLTLGLLALTASCGDDDDEFLECRCANYDIHSEAGFDHLRVWIAQSPIGSQAVPVPQSPDLLEGRSPFPASFEVRWSTSEERQFAPTSTYHYEYSEPWGNAAAIAVVADSAYGFEGGAFDVFDFVHIEQSYYEANGTLELDRNAEVEVWGLPLAGYPNQTKCVRIAGAVEQFIVHPGDRDCDGIPDADDCKPDEFCDPTATTPGIQNACVCP